VLHQLAERTAGLAHVELDVTDQPDVAVSLGVSRTPTTVAFTSDGTELLRVGGVPRRDTLIDALRPHLP
jgi:thioredoxin-like negative regulator of GroEL